MTELTPCLRCAAPIQPNALGCAHCGAADTSAEIRPAAMLLLGLTASGCVGVGQPDYGVAETGYAWTDDDGDGFSVDDGDCDDSDPLINPEAKETPGDGVDSNCDGEDDT